MQMSKDKDIGNLLENCAKKEFDARMNNNSSYTDIMLYNISGRG